MRLFVREVSLVGFKTDSADYWLRLAADRRSNLALFIANDREKERETVPTRPKVHEHSGDSSIESRRYGSEMSFWLASRSGRSGKSVKILISSMDISGYLVPRTRLFPLHDNRVADTEPSHALLDAFAEACGGERTTAGGCGTSGDVPRAERRGDAACLRAGEQEGKWSAGSHENTNASCANGGSNPAASPASVLLSRRRRFVAAERLCAHRGFCKMDVYGRFMGSSGNRLIICAPIVESDVAV